MNNSLPRKRGRRAPQGDQMKQSVASFTCGSLASFVCSVLLMLCCCGALRAQQARPGTENRPAIEKSSGPERPHGGITTLYALDPLWRALCLRDGREGFSLQGNRWGNRCSDLSYSLAGGGSLVTGIEATRVGVIIDLGTANELRERYGYEDADNGGEGFASLQLQGNRILILKEDNPDEALQPLREGPALFGEPGPSANAPIRLGHIYLLRLVDKKDSSFKQIAKLMVVGYSPNESVTLRWALL
jgi:hypothetical protein